MKEFDCSMGFGSRLGKQKRLLPFVGALLVLGCLSCLLFLPDSAFAQNTCNDLTSNAEWNDGMKNVVQLIQANRFNDAQTKAKSLSRICDRSPVLHYMQGRIAEGLGERAEALLHYQKASEYTYQFAVEPEMAKKIWYARYENEHPERTAESLKKNEAEMEVQLDKNQNALSLLEQLQEEKRSHHYRWMWAGVGVGFGGIALMGAGIGLFIDRNAAEITLDSVNGNKKLYSQKPDKLFVTSVALIGSGAALTITGSLLAGIFGYQYSKSKSDINYSISVLPTNAIFSIQF